MIHTNITKFSLVLSYRMNSETKYGFAQLVVDKTMVLQWLGVTNVTTGTTGEKLHFLNNCASLFTWYPVLFRVCVGIRVPPAETESWFCQRCIAKKQGSFSDKKKIRKKKSAWKWSVYCTFFGCNVMQFTTQLNFWIYHQSTFRGSFSFLLC